MAREHKGCTSASCCSPARLWRTLQTIIKSDSKKDLISFFNDELRQEHIVRVALTARLSNDASQLPPSHRHTVIRFSADSSEGNRIFGKATDLNSLQLALMTASEPVVLTLLSQLKLYSSPSELRQFVNHLFGTRPGNTSLHLACFLKRTRVIKVLLSLGANGDDARSKSANAEMDPIIMSHKKCISKQQDETLQTSIIPNEKVPIPVDEEKEKKQETPRDSTGVDGLLLPLIHHDMSKAAAIQSMNHGLKQAIQFIWLNPLKKPPDKQVNNPTSFLYFYSVCLSFVPRLSLNVF